MADEFVLSKADRDKLARMIRWFETFNGPGVTNSPFGPALTPLRGRGGGGSAQALPVRWFKVNSSTVTGVNDTNGNPVQWTYQVTEVFKSTAGYGGWATKSGAYTGTAYNFYEDGNTGTGRQMNGVDHDGADYPAGFQMRPAQDNMIVPGAQLNEVAAGGVEVWIWYLNAEDGACS